MVKRQVKLSLVPFVTLLGFVLAGLVGWVMNIIAIAQLETFTTGMAILRIIGIFIAPLGAVLGYI